MNKSSLLTGVIKKFPEREKAGVTEKREIGKRKKVDASREAVESHFGKREKRGGRTPFPAGRLGEGFIHLTGVDEGAWLSVWPPCSGRKQVERRR